MLPRTMKKRTTALVGILLVVTLTTITALPAEDSATTHVSWTVKPYLTLSVESISTSNTGQSVKSVFQMPKPTDSDFARGYIEQVNAVQLTARSNVDWEVQVKAENETMGTSDNGKYEKPITDLLIKGNGEYQEVDTEPTTIADGENGVHHISVDYKILLDEDYEPGDYKAKLTYTITIK